MIAVSDEILTQTLQEVVDNFLIPKFLSLGMNASGSWIKALRVEVVNGKGYIKGKDYTYYLVNGRSGGNKPPITPLISWVQQKLGKSGREGIGIAYAVQNKIAKEGTDYYPNGTDLLEVLQSKEVTQYIYTRIGQNISGQLQSEIKRRLKQTFK